MRLTGQSAIHPSTMEGQLTMKTSLILCTPTLESLKRGIDLLTVSAEVGMQSGFGH
jgi:hypothetical protein